jgi:hypothetical protein
VGSGRKLEACILGGLSTVVKVLSPLRI